VRLTEIGPRWLHSQDMRLGCHDSIDMFSLAHNEKRIWILLQAADQALGRCEETMRCTGRPILCWLASTKSNEFCPRPFTLLSRKASLRFQILPSASRYAGISVRDQALRRPTEVAGRSLGRPMLEPCRIGRRSHQPWQGRRREL
jgi:hypothetical protein